MKQMTFEEFVKEVTDFVVKYSGYWCELERDQISDYIAKHVQYGTLAVMRDNEEKLAIVGRYNWITENTMYVLDVIARPEVRSYKNLIKFIKRFKAIFPKWEYLYFERLAKYPKKASVGYPLKRLLKEGNTNGRKEIILGTSAITSS